MDKRQAKLKAEILLGGAQMHKTATSKVDNFADINWMENLVEKGETVMMLKDDMERCYQSATKACEEVYQNAWRCASACLY